MVVFVSRPNSSIAPKYAKKALMVFAVLVSAWSRPAGPDQAAAEPETFAQITCTKAQAGGWKVSYKGVGLDYPKGEKIKVTIKRYSRANKVVQTHRTTLTTSRTGSWSTPTYYGTEGADFGEEYIHKVSVYISVQYGPNGAFIDDARDVCGNT